MAAVLRTILFLMKLYGVFVIYDANSNINSSDYRSTILIATFTVEVTNGFSK
jgi:hypothetical protein